MVPSMSRPSPALRLVSLVVVGLSMGCRPKAPPPPLPPVDHPSTVPVACEELSSRLCTELELGCDELAEVLAEHEPSPALCEESLDAARAIDRSERLEPALRQVAYASLLASTLRRTPKAARDTLERLEHLSMLRALPAPYGDEPAITEPPKDLEEALERVTQSYRRADGRDAELLRTELALRRILAEHPDEPRALVLLAQVELELGRVDDALATAQRCAEVEPAMADCWLTIGVLQENARENRAARDAYRAYLRLAPDGAYADEVRRALDRVGP